MNDEYEVEPALNLEDIHGLAWLFRRILWTVALCLVVVAVGVGMFFAWRATR